EVTVMFTDIVGFTTMAETMPAQEVANVLNSHFTLVVDCIEAHGGIVDKYMGDAVMAFWGAPDGDPDHAALACAAALDIMAAVCRDADERRQAGLPPIRVRVGIHSGRVVV